MLPLDSNVHWRIRAQQRVWSEPQRYSSKQSSAALREGLIRLQWINVLTSCPHLCHTSTPPLNFVLASTTHSLIHPFASFIKIISHSMAPRRLNTVAETGSKISLLTGLNSQHTVGFLQISYRYLYLILQISYILYLLWMWAVVGSVTAACLGWLSNSPTRIRVSCKSQGVWSQFFFFRLSC